jgi:hypothetical protein
MQELHRVQLQQLPQIDNAWGENANSLSSRWLTGQLALTDLQLTKRCSTDPEKDRPNRPPV